LPVGGTPLISASKLAQTAGVQEVWIKDDGRNPTGSLKDRASALVVAHAMQIGAAIVTTASTGNAAAALAGLAASAGLRAVIFVPAAAPEAKIAQLMAYGAIVLLVQGNYDQAFDLCVAAAERYGWYCRNTAMNPFTVEGKKTVAIEIAEQLDWQTPDAVVVSVGDGNIIAGVYKGFADLYALGWIERIPRLIGVQAEGSASLYHAWRSGSDGVNLRPTEAHTIADSIAADLPRDRVRAIRAIRQTNGAFMSVTDDEIDAALIMQARQTGVFAEPAAAAALAGLRKARGEGVLGSGDSVVLISTGSGLKDVRGALRAVTNAHDAGHLIRPSLDAVDQLVAELRLNQT
jgi:threonine synthase